MPKPKAGLPYRIVKLAIDMFARDTGFSGPEIHRRFADYTDVLGPYTMGGGGPSRWELFETGLSSLSVDDQRRFLLDLCTYDGPSKYPRPSDEDIAKLRGLLLGGAAPRMAETADLFGCPASTVPRCAGCAKTGAWTNSVRTRRWLTTGEATCATTTRRW